MKPSLELIVAVVDAVDMAAVADVAVIAAAVIAIAEVIVTSANHAGNLKSSNKLKVTGNNYVSRHFFRCTRHENRSTKTTNNDS
jgi:hypothetical protein